MPSATLLSYSYSQQKALFWAGKPTDVIGITGSVYLCYCILKDRDGLKKKVFRRLFLALALAHIILVCIHVLSTIPTPQGSFYGSLGSRQSCSAIGFLSHIAYTMTMVYNGSIGVYYYIVFTYNWSDQTIKQKAEPFFHAMAVIYPVLGPILGLAFGMYNADPILLQCYASPAPLGCGESGGMECERGHRFRGLFVWLTGFVELNVGTVIKLGAVVKIMITVLLQQRRNKKRFRESIAGRTSTINEHSFHIQSQMQEKKKKKIKRTTVAEETCWQSFWFLLSCFVPYCMGLFVKMVDLYWVRIPEDRKAPGWLFVLTFISTILFPMQGVFNTLIYLRPNYMRRRRTHGENESAWECAKATVYTSAGLAYDDSNRAATSTTVTRYLSSRMSTTADQRTSLRGRFTSSIRSLGKNLSMEISSSHRNNTIANTSTSGRNDNNHMRSGQSPSLSDDAEESKESFAEASDVECDSQHHTQGNDETEETRSTAPQQLGVLQDIGHGDDNESGEASTQRLSCFKDELPSLHGDGLDASQGEDEEVGQRTSEVPHGMDHDYNGDSRQPADGHLSGLIDFAMDDDDDDDDSSEPADGHLSGFFENEMEV
ncbi:expressed unknown protein [Seminavis robusta]|uniref:Uncharacterized protein n=1 Tax=Seminavis robusta TaxID=568900 RepID=A0A9N8F0J9_9STRA|nr:expressed unknown protein [Seminavis robusta]|eukprot:Sro2160_g317050.1 n/a (600) ;mRNA; f:2921-4793